MAVNAMRHHQNVVLGVVGLLILWLGVYVFRRIFDRRRGVRLPVEDDEVEVGRGDAL